MQPAAGYSVRSYLPSDLAAVRRMMNGLHEAERAMEPNRAHWPDGGIAYTDWTLDEVAEHAGAVFLALATPGRPIGFLICWRAEDASDITVVPEARVHLYISDLYVEEDWRGRGVAGALLAEAERHGRALGLTQMTIGVLAVNAAARNAYAKAGFAEYEMLLRKPL